MKWMLQIYCIHINAQLLSGILKWVSTAQIIKTCTLHLFLLHYKHLKVQLKRRRKQMHTKYNALPVKVNTAWRVSCLGGGLYSRSASWIFMYSQLKKLKTAFCSFIPLHFIWSPKTNRLPISLHFSSLIDHLCY